MHFFVKFVNFQFFSIKISTEVIVKLKLIKKIKFKKILFLCTFQI